MEIGKIYQVTITGLSHEGHGIGKIDGQVIFIPHALIDEKVFCKVTKIKNNYGIGELQSVILSAKNRVKPICSYFGRCGGCNLMHMDYESQLQFKKKTAEDTFRKIGHLDCRIDEVYGMEDPYFYRNKIQMPFGIKNGKVIAGYYQEKSHHIIPIDRCYIQPQEGTQMVLFIRNLANEFRISGYDEKTGKGILRHVLLRVNKKQEWMVVLVVTAKITYLNKLVNKIVERYPKVCSIIENINSKDTNVILGHQSYVVYGSEFIEDELMGAKFRLSHYSFFQVNAIQTAVLYQKVIDFLACTEKDTIIDAYCGVGTISIILAKLVKRVFGIEEIPAAIKDAEINARLNNVNNITFTEGLVEKEIPSLLNNAIDAIVVDPPRKGLDQKVISCMLDTNIPKIVYVSCNVATLARDLEKLQTKYEIKKTAMVDMFPQSNSMETVVLLEVKENGKINNTIS
ncbi:MAG: 23S rRNA (uracil(1939)-C(5))-methyltransferase RlmD [Bacilli bacterium]|jgi:23S rRNA (uracil1939-C5)-methyltransferase|nr:23S rRNA (uracil(1939)-C(5))-methyltransferase RlmD [Bacilli bacterium]